MKDIRRATRRHFSAEDKIRIVLEGLRNASCWGSYKLRNRLQSEYWAPETGALFCVLRRCMRPVSDCNPTRGIARMAQNCAVSDSSSYSIRDLICRYGLFGAVEKTRTSTGVSPQRPQRCASTSSATTALKSGGACASLRGRSGPLAKGSVLRKQWFAGRLPGPLPADNMAVSRSGTRLTHYLQLW